MADLNLTVDAVNVSARQSSLDIEIEGADTKEVLDHFDELEAVEHFGVQDLVSAMDQDSVLDEIGAEKVKEYFNLTEEK